MSVIKEAIQAVLAITKGHAVNVYLHVYREDSISDAVEANLRSSGYSLVKKQAADV